MDNLPWNMNNWLRNLFNNHGKVVDAFVLRKIRRGTKGHFAFVRFKK